MKLKFLLTSITTGAIIVSAISCGTTKSAENNNTKQKQIKFNKHNVVWTSNGINGNGAINVAPINNNQHFTINFISKKRNNFNNGDEVSVILTANFGWEFEGGSKTKIVKWIVSGLTPKNNQIKNKEIMFFDSDFTWKGTGKEGSGVATISLANGFTPNFRIGTITPNNTLRNGDEVSVILTANSGWEFEGGSKTKIVKWIVAGLTQSKDTTKKPDDKIKNQISGKTKFIPFADFTLNSVARNAVANYLKNNGVKNFMAGFAFMKNNNELTMSTWESLDRNISTIKEIQKSGINVGVSFGGAYAQNKMPADVATTNDELYNIYVKLIKKIPNLKFLDWDIEGWTNLSNIKSNNLRVKAMERLHQNYPNIELSITIPTATNGPISSGYNIIKPFKNIVDRINIMAMDYGPTMTNKAMGDASISAVEGLARWMHTNQWTNNANDYSKIGLIPMIGKNDTDGETFDLDQARRITNWAKQTNLGVLSMWSLTRDEGNSDPVLNTHIGTDPFAFSNIFKTIENTSYSIEIKK